MNRKRRTVIALSAVAGVAGMLMAGCSQKNEAGPSAGSEDAAIMRAEGQKHAAAMQRMYKRKPPPLGQLGAAH